MARNKVIYSCDITLMNVVTILFTPMLFALFYFFSLATSPEVSQTVKQEIMISTKTINTIQ